MIRKKNPDRVRNLAEQILVGQVARGLGLKFVQQAAEIAVRDAKLIVEWVDRALKK